MYLDDGLKYLEDGIKFFAGNLSPPRNKMLLYIIYEGIKYFDDNVKKNLLCFIISFQGSSSLHQFIHIFLQVAYSYEDFVHEIIKSKLAFFVCGKFADVPKWAKWAIVFVQSFSVEVCSAGGGGGGR